MEKMPQRSTYKQVLAVLHSDTLGAHVTLIPFNPMHSEPPAHAKAGFRPGAQLHKTPASPHCCKMKHALCAQSLVQNLFKFLF